MKFLVLSRPVVNAGDYLFTYRALELIKHLRPDVEIVSGHSSKDFELEYLNLFSAIIVAGGPVFNDRFLNREALPILRKLYDLKPRVHFLCGGFYGDNSDVPYIYIYKYSKKVIDDLKFIENAGGTFSVRDYITEAVLRNNGLSNIYMTGCSAWYAIEDANKIYTAPTSIKKIVISDPGVTKVKNFHEKQYQQLVSVVFYIISKFPNAHIKYTFNGGIYTKYSRDFNLRVAQFLKALNIEYYDISGSMKGFEIYDDCDLHIGYRVHSHIYCLSKCISTILIEEDARGAGVNEALGLPRIKNYSMKQEEKFIPNPYLLQQLDLYIDELEREKYSRIKFAIERMKDIYSKVLCPFIMRL